MIISNREQSDQKTCRMFQQRSNLLVRLSDLPRFETRLAADLGGLYRPSRIQELFSVRGTLDWINWFNMILQGPISKLDFAYTDSCVSDITRH